MRHRHVGSGVWGIWDGGVMSWRATDLAEDDARQQAADLNVSFNQYGPRDQADRREVSPPIEVESAARRRLRKPVPPRHWLRRDAVESPPSRSPTGD
jgi:hypothetical protein